MRPDPDARPDPCRPGRVLLAALVTAGTLASLTLAPMALADITDEIQVYTDDINAPGETGLELHVNTTPSGRSTAGYPGEVTPAHGWRVTPEFSFGLSNDWELGAYLPTVMRSGGQYDVAGAKIRLKWLPVHGGDGFFYGVNAELSRMAQRFSEARTSAELRFISGWRSGPWLLAVNPILDFGLSDGERLRNPDAQLGMKAGREIWPGISLGSEYYWSPGKIDDLQAVGRSPNTLFAVADFDLKPYVFNLGIGRGTSTSADRWTVKAIFEIPF